VQRPGVEGTRSEKSGIWKVRRSQGDLDREIKVHAERKPGKKAVSVEEGSAKKERGSGDKKDLSKKKHSWKYPLSIGPVRVEREEGYPVDPPGRKKSEKFISKKNPITREINNARPDILVPRLRKERGVSNGSSHF